MGEMIKNQKWHKIVMRTTDQQPFLWCTRCGAYAAAGRGMLKGSCRGKAGSVYRKKNERLILDKAKVPWQNGHGTVLATIPVDPDTELGQLFRQDEVMRKTGGQIDQEGRPKGLSEDEVREATNEEKKRKCEQRRQEEERNRKKHRQVAVCSRVAGQHQTGCLQGSDGRTVEKRQ